MWELFNPGLSLYHEITNNAQVVAGIIAGKRLEIPPQCPKACSGTSYESMLDIPNHTKRPSLNAFCTLW